MWTVTDSTGKFTLIPNQIGYYSVTAYFIGYQKRKIDSIVDFPQHLKVLFGKIYLNQVNHSLEEVVVTGNSQVLEETAEKMVFRQTKI
jgi:hypothetical protein